MEPSRLGLRGDASAVLHLQPPALLALVVVEQATLAGTVDERVGHGAQLLSEVARQTDLDHEAGLKPPAGEDARCLPVVLYEKQPHWISLVKVPPPAAMSRLADET